MTSQLVTEPAATQLATWPRLILTPVWDVGEVVGPIVMAFFDSNASTSGYQASSRTQEQVSSSTTTDVNSETDTQDLQSSGTSQEITSNARTED